jgi:hypothetical protein
MKFSHLLKLSILNFFVSISAFAGLERELYRGVEPLAMGNAYVAIADDEHAIFYNPAGVAGYDNMRLHYLALQFTGSEDSIKLSDTLKDLKDFSGSDINQFMGKNIYAEANGSAALTVPHFGIAAIYDAQAALYARNQSFPKIEYAYQRTSGVQAAFGFSTQQGRKRGYGKRNSDFMSEWRFGVAAKYLVRRGGYRILTPVELAAMDSEQIKTLVGGKGDGYGVDAGIQRFHRVTPASTFHFGAAYSNIGDVAFGGGADAVKSGLAAGIGWSQNLGLGVATLVYDLRQITADADWRKKHHLGLRFSFPLLVDLYAGMNQTYFTYGASVDIWLLKVSAASYCEEMGVVSAVDPERRYALRIDFKFGL